MKNLHTTTIWPVQAPCLIAYRDPLTGYFWLRPYVDLQLKSKIWGIAVHGQVFKLVHEDDGSWFEAKKRSDDLSRAKMPSTTVIDIASAYRREFDATVELLKQLKIEAEPWRSGWYWTNEEDGDKATVLDMANGRIEFVPKKMRNGYVRLVSNYITKKPITVGYSLAYLNEGRLEISTDYKPELKNQLWGLHVGKNFLCMRLTYEKDSMDWQTGFELGKSLSTDKLDVALPKAGDVDNVGKEKDAINNALVKLSAYGINVDLIVSRDLHWLTQSSYGNDMFLTYNHFLVHKDSCRLCRLFATNKGKTVVI